MTDRLTKEAEHARLERAALLQVRELGPTTYEVSGGSRSHRVSVGIHAGPKSKKWFCLWCDCEDFRIGHGLRACKHVLVVGVARATNEERAEIAAALGIVP